MAKKAKKLGAVEAPAKRSKKRFLVSDPERADRFFEFEGEALKLEAGAAKGKEVSAAFAAHLQEKYPYLVVEQA